MTKRTIKRKKAFLYTHRFHTNARRLYRVYKGGESSVVIYTADTTYADTAYVILHFGAKSLYLEMEMYLICNLYIQTSEIHDIVYLYAQDTPESFINAISCISKNVSQIHKCRDRIIFKEYTDTHITNATRALLTTDVINTMIKKRKQPGRPVITPESMYAIALNMARTLGIIYAWDLPYKTVCIVESDLVLIKSYDSVFKEPSPAIFVYDNGNVNGGVIRLNPNADEFMRGLECVKTVVSDPLKYVYPSESLFTTMYPLYTKTPLPQTYNLVRRNQAPSDNLADIHAIHFSESNKLFTYATKYEYTSRELATNTKYWMFDNIICGLDFFFTHLIKYKNIVCLCMETAQFTNCISRDLSETVYFSTENNYEASNQEPRYKLKHVRDILYRNYKHLHSRQVSNLFLKKQNPKKRKNK